MYTVIQAVHLLFDTVYQFNFISETQVHISIKLCEHTTQTRQVI